MLLNPVAVPPYSPVVVGDIERHRRLTIAALMQCNAQLLDITEQMADPIPEELTE